MLEQHDGSMLGNISGLITGGKHTMLVEMGQKILQSLFGDKLISIISTTGKLVGLDADNTGSMLGMLAPILMSVLGKQKKSAGWDVGKFSAALMGQKELMPNMDPGLTKALGVGNLLSANTVTTGSAGRATTGGSDRTTAGQSAQAGGSLLKVVVPLLAVVVLVFLAWKFLMAPPAPNPPPGTPDTNQSAGDDGRSGLATDSDVGGALAQAKELLRNITTTIESVKDEATAKSAATRLEELTAKVDGPGLGKLDGMAKTGFQIAMKAFRSKMDSVLEKVYKTPGVEPILKPAIEALLTKFGGA